MANLPFVIGLKPQKKPNEDQQRNKSRYINYHRPYHSHIGF